MREVEDPKQLKGKFCGTCLSPAEKVMSWGQISCPDGKAGCAVYHAGWTCSDCGGHEVKGWCDKCEGTGRYNYPNTGVWRSKPGDGMIVGQGFTWSTCDTCWGSGDAENPGTDLRKQEER